MKKFINNYIAHLAICFLLLVLSSSCGKDEYYQDGGVANAKFEGTVLQYLESNSKFDTIAQIVKLAGMEDIFSNEEITFFAPTDEVIRRTIGLVDSDKPFVQGMLNQQLFDSNKDTIKVLSDIPAATWRRFMMKYLMKGKYYLKDFPQLDPDLRALHPGGYYYTYNGDLANIGTVFGSFGGVKYTGYRQLSFAVMPDPSNVDRRNTAAVSSSDIQPRNGVVHVLAVFSGVNNDGVVPFGSTTNWFGLGEEFRDEVILNR